VAEVERRDHPTSLATSDDDSVRRLLGGDSRRRGTAPVVTTVVHGDPDLVSSTGYLTRLTVVL
jgi:hypothetical protein